MKFKSVTFAAAVAFAVTGFSVANSQNESQAIYSLNDLAALTAYKMHREQAVAKTGLDSFKTETMLDSFKTETMLDSFKTETMLDSFKTETMLDGEKSDTILGSDFSL